MSATAGGRVLRGQEDAWLGDQLGRPALRLDLVEAGDDADLRRRLREDAVFATAKVPVDRIGPLRVLEDAGCRVVDVSLGFEAASDRVVREADAATGAVRHAVPEDAETVRAIAGRAFRFSRFHLDEAIPAPLADALKASWAANYFAGRRGSALLIAEDTAGTVCGFLQVLEQDETAVIDLIAVSPEAGGQGHGTALVAALARAPLSTGRPPRRLRVGTQAANGPAARFYERLGFRLASATFVLHHHGSGPSYTVG